MIMSSLPTPGKERESNGLPLVAGLLTINGSLPAEHGQNPPASRASTSNVLGPEEEEGKVVTVQIRAVREEEEEARGRIYG